MAGNAWQGSERAELTDGYAALAAGSACGEVAPVGQAWQLVWSMMPAPALHTADLSHPNTLGSYLAALVLARDIAGVEPAGAWSPEGLSGTDVMTVQMAAAAAP